MNKKDRPYEQKKCPQCGAAFLCSTSAKCWCMEYSLSPETLDKLQQTWDTCLCPECLKAFETPVEKSICQ